MQAPVTLGDKLSALQDEQVFVQPRSKGGSILRWLLNLAILTALTALPLWWLVAKPQDGTVLMGIALALAVLWGGVSWLGRPKRITRRADHFLLDGDQQGFMAHLRLDAKTAIIDGSNLYHFGLNENLGAQALTLVAQGLRDEGYRNVCFFDANIFYRLIEHGTLKDADPHAVYLLTQIFGLDYEEIYVVPSRVQADRYILSTLKHLPTSFAVTNDRFRDYAKTYKDVMTSGQWRKGVEVDGNELRLLNFRFQRPIRLNKG